MGESKILNLKKVLEEALARPDTSPRKVAALAGKILALSPAVLPAALYSQEFYLVLKGRLTWDELFPNPESVAEAARFWLENLDRFNGRKWWPKQVAMPKWKRLPSVMGGLLELERSHRCPSQELSPRMKRVSRARRVRCAGTRAR